MDNSQTPDLLRVMRAEFGVSKRCWNITLQAQIGMLLLGWLVPYLSFAPAWAWGIAGLVISIMAIMMKYLGDQHYDRGERARRLAFRQEGLGRPLHPEDLLLTLATSPTRAPADPPPIGRYFGSSRDVGPRKVLDNLYESSFYTHQVASTVRNDFGIVCAIGLFGAFALLRATAGRSGLSSASEDFGRIVTDVVSFFAAGAFLEAALVYHQLSRSAERTFQRCGVLEAGADVPEAAVFEEVAEYDCALAKARPLPTWAYRLRRKQMA